MMPLFIVFVSIYLLYVVTYILALVYILTTVWDKDYGEYVGLVSTVMAFIPFVNILLAKELYLIKRKINKGSSK